MNRSPWPFRLQIVLLWVGHLARVLGENCVRFIVLTAPLIELYRRESTPHREGGPDLLTVSYQPVWVVVASALPALALLPVLGRFARREVARTSLVASTLLALAVVAACLFTGSYTLIALAAISATSAVYAASRSVLLPELARGAAVPLVRLRASLAAFAALGVVGGVWLGAAYAAFDPFAEFAQTEYARSARAEPAGTLSPAAGVAFAAFAVAFLALLPLRLLPRGPEEPWADNISVPEGMTARWAWILRHRDAAAPLTALVVGGVVLLGAVYLVARTAPPEGIAWGDVWWMGGAFAAGAVFASAQSHPFRIRAMFPIALVGLFACSIYAAAAAVWTVPLLWFFLGMAYLPLIATFQIALPERVQPEGFALYLGTGAAALALAALFLGYLLGGAGALPGLAIPVVTGLALVVFGWLYLRPMIESLAEVLLWPMYRVSATGPGLERFPMHGPVLVLGNHTSYLDPLFLSKHTPRPIIAIMTSRFYDMKLLRPLMKYVFRAIRVPERPVRREAPELKEAVAALDRGECFVIFPEGYLQRKDEPVLRRFARGVWEILAARPNTPVIACWLEGGWGTYFSYKNGPPMTNKPMDWWVRIRVAYGEGERIPPEVLADHIRTRRYLMERCLQARELLGLPPAEVPLPRVGEPAEREPEPVPPDPPDPAGPVEQPPSR